MAAWFAIPAIPPILSWLGVGAGAHLVAPGRQEREQSIQQLFTGAQNDADSKAAPIARTETCATCEPQDDCLLDEYQQIKKACNDRGGEAHHIVPDMVYRLGTAPTSDYMKSETLERAPKAPTYNQGMSICLTKAQHRSVGVTPPDQEGVHPALERDMKLLASTSPVEGTAPIGVLMLASVAALNRVPGLSAECKAKAVAATNAQVASHTGLEAPGRAVPKPLPTGDAYTVIHRGYYEL